MSKYRPSPSESATLFNVGTKRIGNDGNMYIVKLTSRNIQRWVRYKDAHNTKSAVKKSVKKKSAVKKSVKKKSVKKSVKKKSAVKKSVKKKSVKKKSAVKKSVKKKSAVKKSVKKKSAVNNSGINRKFNKGTFKVMLANKYSGQDPSGYYISEKLDGMRGIYDGKSDSFVSRNNKPINAPAFFSEKFPKDLVLDGELFTKRGNFVGTGIFRKKIPVDSEWRNAVYMVFDIPLVNLPYSERYALMKKRLGGIPYLKIVNHTIVKDSQHMNTIHHRLVSQGAEGTMLRHPDSFYENKRSKYLLKVKDFLDDEVIIVDMEYGSGKYKDVMGNLIVKWAPEANKTYTGTFDVGSGFTDYQRENWKRLFKKGTKLTIKYFELSGSGKPRFPIFQHIRHNE